VKLKEAITIILLILQNQVRFVISSQLWRDLFSDREISILGEWPLVKLIILISFVFAELLNRDFHAFHIALT
jgi:hypothetical protein